MKPRIIVILGPSFGGYSQMVANGFRQNGLKTRCFCYPEPPRGPLELLAWDYLPRLRLRMLRQIAMDRILAIVEETVKNAGLFVIIKGDGIPIQRYASLLADVRCPKVLWLMDSVHGVREGLERVSLADVILTFDGTDSRALANLPTPHHMVALAVDPEKYLPIEGLRHKWDLSFIGALYPNRLAVFDAVLAALPQDQRIEARFVSNYRSYFHPLRTRKVLGSYPAVAPYLKQGDNWPHQAINRLYNQSRICLNVFHPQSVESVNPRSFEICCSGAFQLTQQNAAIARYLEIGREVEVFETPQEGAEKICYYLRNRSAAMRIGMAGRRRVLADHTFAVRTGQIVDMLKQDGILQGGFLDGAELRGNEKWGASRP